MSELQPNIAGSWANLALIKIKQGELKQASAFANTALTKNPNMPQALNLSGYLAQQRGEINQAKSYYLQAITYKEDYQWYLAYSEQKDEATENWLEGLKATMAASNS